MKKLLLLFFISVSLFASFNRVDAKKLVQLQKQGVVVIDIRREEEWKATGIIPNAKTITFFDKNGKYDLIKFMAKFTKYVKDKNQPFIIYCAHGNRSKIVGNFFNNIIGVKEVYDLEGGIIYGWIDKGFKTIKYEGK